MTSATVPTAPPARHSSEAEIAAFEQVCERLAGFDETLSLEWMDGWLAALACAPAQPAPEAWLPAMAGDAFERAFADPPDRAQALGALQARLAVLREQLDPEVLLDHPEALRLDPVLFEWTDEDRRRAMAEHGVSEDEAATLQTGALWAEGVLEGLEALPTLGALEPARDEDDEAHRGELIAQVEGLILDPGSDEGRAFVAQYHPGREPTRDDLIAEACYALQDLRVWWLDHAPRPQTRRVAATPGRNDPCPCGSGKKYKKCCGAAGA